MERIKTAKKEEKGQIVIKIKSIEMGVKGMWSIIELGI